MKSLKTDKRMWILRPDDQKAQKYRTLFFQLTKYSFDKKTKRKTYLSEKDRNCKAYDFLTEQKVHEYMIARPERLLLLHEELLTEVGDNGMLSDEEKHCIKSIFNYDYYIGKHQELSYAIAQLLNVNTCTYCNREYILTVVEEKKSETHFYIRPEFDHWFSQNDYPDLALSFYNLIPSCHTCNSVIKGDNKMNLGEHIHPYMDKQAGFKFSYVPTSNGNAVDVVREDGVDDTYFERVDNTLRFFKTAQIYGAHSDLELKDLMVLAEANPKDYIFTLMNGLSSKLGINEDDAYRILFGIEVNEEKYLKRPMSKFKSDIIRKIKKDLQ